MFEVGFTEIILILGIALLVLGPEKLPGLARKVGRWAGRARSMARQLRQQLDEEVTVVSKSDLDLEERPRPATPPPTTPSPPTPQSPPVDPPDTTGGPPPSP